MCDTVHPDTNKEGRQDVYIPWEILVQPLIMLFEHGKRQIWLIWAYLGSFLGPEAGPYGPEWVDWSTRIPLRKVNMT